MHHLFVDAQQRHREIPDTFDAPTAGELASLRRGSVVKLSLLDIERMWFVVLARLGDRMIVALKNTPAVVTEVRFEDLFVCETRHVLDIGPAVDKWLLVAEKIEGRDGVPLAYRSIDDFEKKSDELVERWKDLTLTPEHRARLEAIVNGKLEPSPNSATAKLPN